MAWNAVNCDLLAVGYGRLDVYSEANKLGEAVDEQLQVREAAVKRCE